MKTSKELILGDHILNSHGQSDRSSIDITRRSLMLITTSFFIAISRSQYRTPEHFSHQFCLHVLPMLVDGKTYQSIVNILFERHIFPLPTITHVAHYVELKREKKQKQSKKKSTKKKLAKQRNNIR